MTLLPLDDSRWGGYCGGYNRSVCDVVPFLKKLQSLDVSEDDWNILWDDLHHQGDIGDASYAVVPYLVEYVRKVPVIAWHAFGFAATVELERTGHGNPEVPTEIRSSYDAAIQELPELALSRGVEHWDEYCFEPVMACIALSLGRRTQARAYLDLTETEIVEFNKYLDIIE